MSQQLKHCFSIWFSLILLFCETLPFTTQRAPLMAPGGVCPFHFRKTWLRDMWWQCKECNRQGQILSSGSDGKKRRSGLHTNWQITGAGIKYQTHPFPLDGRSNRSSRWWQQSAEECGTWNFRSQVEILSVTKVLDIFSLDVVFHPTAFSLYFKI